MQTTAQIKKVTVLSKNAISALLEFEKYVQSDPIYNIVICKNESQMSAEELELFNLVFDTFQQIRDTCIAWD